MKKCCVLGIFFFVGGKKPMYIERMLRLYIAIYYISKVAIFVDDGLIKVIAA